MFSLLETWAVDITDTLAKFPDYCCHCINGLKQNIQGRAMGGIAVFVCRKFNELVKRIHTACEFAVVLELIGGVISENKCILIYPYIPPEASPFYINRERKGIQMLEELILELITQDTVELILMGDLNSRTSNNADFVTSRGDSCHARMSENESQ